MFTCSVKLRKRWLVIGAAGLIGLVVLLLLAQTRLSRQIDFVGGEEYLAVNGLSGELISEDEVLIPEEFSPIYEEYNQMQKTQGFDLSDYAGKTCQRYTYRLTGTPEEVHAVFLVYHGTLIGGDLHEQRYGGWIQPLQGNL